MSAVTQVNSKKNAILNRGLKKILLPSREQTSVSPSRSPVPHESPKSVHKPLQQRFAEFHERRLLVSGKSLRLLRGTTLLKPNSTTSQKIRRRSSSEISLKKVWESVKIVLLVYTFVYHPLKMLVFREANISATLYFQLFEYLVDLFFLADLVINFFIPSDYGLMEETSCKQTTVDYLKGHFFFDLVAIIPYGLIYERVSGILKEEYGSVSEILRIVQMFKLFRLRHLFRIITKMKAYSEHNYLLNWLLMRLAGSLIGQMLPNLLLILSSMHLFTCIWIYIGQTSQDKNNWLVLNKLYDKELFDRYTYSFYSVVQTFTTVGYGDVKSTLSLEQFVRIIGIVAGVLIYNMFSGQIVNYQGEQHFKSDTVHNKRIKFTDMALRYGISNRIEKLVMQSLDEQMTKCPPERKPDFNMLEKEDREELEYTVFLSRFQGIPMFSSSELHRNFVLDLGRSVKVIEFEFEKIIYEKGEPPGACYFIAEGHVEVLSTLAESIPLCQIKKGYFGEIELMQNELRRFTIQSSARRTVLLCLPWDKFKEIIRKKENERFRDSLLAYSLKRWNKIQQIDYKVTKKLKEGNRIINPQHF